MDVSLILDSLNKEQREVVSAASQHALVLAGAGSGKTRVLTHRIAWLCGVENFSPYSIVAVTFTNKASQEMRARVEALLDIPAQGLWLGTFHGLCHRLLRMHWREAGLQQAFQVLDSADQRRLIKRVTTDLNLDTTRWPAKESQWFINARKEEGVRPDSIQVEDSTPQQLLRIYTAYEESCRNSSLVDFAELLLRVIELLRDNDTLRGHYHERFRCILVDEFQDTNALQYAWLRLLAGAGTPVFAVGDDDQSIYGWRGARVEHLHDFIKHFPNTEIYRLERNYRSTSTILKAANALIANNQNRMGKNLWTDLGDGDPIMLFAALNEQEEARFVVNRVVMWIEGGRAREEAAILYRSNAQSRAIEEVLIAKGIPYRVYGGMRFFERAVIKDALAYLKIAVNPEDDQSYERIINMPPRGIGERTLEKIRSRARAGNCSLWQAGRLLLEEQDLPARSTKMLGEFHQLVERLGQGIGDLSLREASEQMINSSGLVGHYRRRNDEKSLSEVENLEEFVTAAAEFERSWSPEEGITPRDAFLAHAALEAGEGQAAENDDCVQLMTLHSAKGLEFPLVMMIGMEENLFPHARSLGEIGGLEEERRLCYVGITRAREKLMMTYAETRRYYGGETYNRLSRFIGEIPPELIEEVRPRQRISVPSALGRNLRMGKGEVNIGSYVEHHKFGKGIVLDCEGAGSSARVQVRFDHAGVKWLVLAYAGMELL